MSPLTRDDVRLLFMREGKRSGAIWPWLEEEVPTLVRTQLVALIEAAGDAFSGLEEHDRDALMATFIASARKSRTPGQANDGEYAQVTPDALRTRVAAALEMVNAAASAAADDAAAAVAARDEAWGHPTSQALDVVHAVSAKPDNGISIADAMVLHREIGRLIAPLWVSGDWDHLPEMSQVSAAALGTRLKPLLRSEPRFNENTWEFDTPSSEESLALLHNALLDSLRGARDVYFDEHPVDALPTDSTLRLEEQERRARWRVAASQRAEDAINQILLPLSEAVTEHLRIQAVAAEASTREEKARQLAARIAAGFRRPDAQLYGASQDGARAWVADALRWLGEHDAEFSEEPTDGFDIVSARMVVRVVHHHGRLQAATIRELFGVATALNRLAVVWTSGTLADDARNFADLVSVAVVRYDVAESIWAGLNDSGADFLLAFDS